MTEKPKKPSPLWPDTTTVISVLFLLLSWRLFEAIIENPSLADNQGFMVLAQAVIVTGAIGLVGAFYFAAGKKDRDQQEILEKQADALRAGNDPAWIEKQVGDVLEEGELPADKRIQP